MSKYRLLRERIASADWIGSCQLCVPPAASEQELTTVHDPEYVRRVMAGELSDLEQRRIGFPWSDRMVERSRRSTGASIAAARAALQDGCAVNLAGGTHHAMPDAGGGYCVFNDVCVAARVMQRSGLVERVLFVDLDVHQGNGTAAVAAGDPTLFAFSMHCDRNYPFRKTAGDLDVALPAGSGDEEYLTALDAALQQILAVFCPDLVFFLAGADPWEGDRLGQLALTRDGLLARDRLVLERFRSLDVPVAISMAGGYAPNVEDIVAIHFQTIATAVTMFVPGILRQD